ncbi:MAG: hypothetical protein ACFBSF_13815 [Leptolyngbyaceae cyanobacterium]
MSDPDTLEKVKVMDKPASPRKSIWRWQWLIAPLMGVSVVLHIVLLFVPIPSTNLASEDEIEEEELESAAEEEEVIDILNLSEITAPEPPPEEEPPPQEQQAPPPPAENVAPNLDPTQIPPETPEAVPPVDDGAATQAFVDASRDQFIGGLDNLGVADYTSQFGLPEPKLFRRPDSAGCFIDASGNPAPNIRVLNWIDKEPQTLLQENLQAVYGQSGVAFVEQSSYCSERYFYLYAPNGEFFMAMSLVQMEGSALLVGWETRPQ